MINCLALDDEPLALRQLTNYLEKVPFFTVVNSCLSVSEALKTLSENKIDVVFLDINMPDLNGLELVRSLVDPPMVVFTTAYSEYAIEGYKTNAVDYLLKPYGMDDIQRAANKVKQRYDLLQAAHETTVDANGTVFLKTGYKVVRVRIADITYVKGMSEYLRIYLSTDPKPIIVLLSMKKMEDWLRPHNFMRIHRSYIVNLNLMQELKKDAVVLSDGTEIPIGDTYRADIHDYVARLSLGK